MDSSYLSGNFSVRYFNDTIQVLEKTNFLSEETLKKMRQEILADNGFIFKYPAISDYYQNASWYNPTISSYDELYSKASEIDKYNLDFLAKILGPVKKPI